MTPPLRHTFSTFQKPSLFFKFFSNKPHMFLIYMSGTILFDLCRACLFLMGHLPLPLPPYYSRAVGDLLSGGYWCEVIICVKPNYIWARLRLYWGFVEVRLGFWWYVRHMCWCREFEYTIRKIIDSTQLLISHWKNIWITSWGWAVLNSAKLKLALS